MMRIDLLVTMAYHPQTDWQSEWANQTVEVALRYLVNVCRTDWAEHLVEVEFHINNTANASSSTSLMEFLTGVNGRTVNTVALPSTPTAVKNWTQRGREIRDEAGYAMVYAQTKMSMYYNKNHKPVSFNVGDSVYINLQKDIGTPGYKLPNDTVARKLSPRRVGPFKVLKKVGDLAYQLDISSNWRIHNMISVAHLEPAKEDTYARVIQPPPES
jgi:hypothetical protein